MSINFIEFYKHPVGFKNEFLTIERAMHSEDDLLFLEDVVHTGRREIISVTRDANRLVRIADNGDSNEINISNYCKKKIKNCHTLKNGNRILQTAEPCENYLVGADFQLIKKIAAGKRLWHGTNSVDSTASGTVMYSEYISTKEKTAQPLYVWRSQDFGETWHVAMEKMSSPVYGVGECRHFHTCFSDPDISGRWYVTTGDIRQDNCFFYSDDDGESWNKAEVRLITPGGLISNEFRDNVFRFTSSYFDGNDIVWPTDDSLGIGKAVLARMDKTKLPNVEIRIEHIFDKNLMRSAISDINSNGKEVFISEAKDNLSGLSLYIKDDMLEDVMQMPSISNLSGEPSGGTISKASRIFVNETAYSLGDIKLFGDEKPSLLKYQFKKSTTPIPNVRVPSKMEVAGRPLVFFHAQRTAGTTIKSVFQQEFGEENCLYQRLSKEFCDWKDLNENTLNKYRIYAGHYNYAPKEMQCDPLIFSVIRHPVERAISLYHYLKGRPEHKLHGLAVNEDILTFYKKAVEVAPDYVSNTQTLRISGARDFERSKEIIEDKYFFVAPFDELEKVFSVFRQYSLVSSSSIPDRKSMAAYKPAFYNKDLRALVYEINQQDFVLFDYAKMYFHQFYHCVKSEFR